MSAAGGRPATGSVKWRRHAKPPHRLQWHARITLADGSRPWIALDPSIAADDVAGARRCAAETSADFREHGHVRDSVRETVAEYAARWLASREGVIASNADSASHLRIHVLPVLGPLDMRAIGRDDIERFVAVLDKKVRAGEMSASTAGDRWGTLTKMFKDATFAKPATGLRCLTVDPTHNVRGPDDDGADKSLQFLYPSEFSQFMVCREVPRAWRRNVAIALYLALRDGEQRALQWSNVDLEHGVVTVAEVIDRKTNKRRDGTKGSNKIRMVPIPATLAPLLAAMKKASKGKGLVCPRSTTKHMARDLRRWLMVANVTRSQLHDDTTVNKPLRWHDLRATGLTWYAVTGRSSTEIRDIAGHTMTSMTDRYMRTAGVIRAGRFGEVFPPLPDPSDLVAVGSASVSSRDDTPRAKYAKPMAYMVEAPRIEGLTEDCESSQIHVVPELPPSTHSDETSRASRPFADAPMPSALPVTEPTDAELERGILDAVRIGLGDVARTLSAQLTERQRARVPANVVDLDKRRGRTL
jgi:integrase